MVIREKELARLMKDAYKRGGYNVAVRNNGKTVIFTDDWMVETDNAKLPREALSILVLHMGFCPETEEAYKIYKGGSEPEVQTKLYQSAEAYIEQMDILREEAKARSTTVCKTVMTYNGYNIWQRDNGGILLIDPGHERLLYKKDDVLYVGTSIYAGDAESRVYITCQPEPEISSLKHLAAVKWPTVT